MPAAEFSGPFDCPTCGKVHRRGCRGHRSTDGEPCAKYPIRGAKTCEAHGSATQKSRAQAEVRDLVNLSGWQLGDPDTNPGEKLLMLVAQSAELVQKYGRSVGQLVAEADGDLEKALVREVWSTDESGQSRKTGEYVKAIPQQFDKERDRLARYATAAISAGLAERQVRLAEDTGRMVAGMYVLMSERLGLTDEQRALMPALLAQVLSEVSGERLSIEGTAA